MEKDWVGLQATPKDELLSYAETYGENDSLILGIRMLDGSKEIIINPNAKSKLDYIRQAYNEELGLKTVPDIYIEEWCFMKG